MKKEEAKDLKGKRTQERKITGNKEINENIEKLEKEINSKKNLPKEIETKIIKKIFENILIADVIMLFLFFISLGSINIESSAFVTNLKVSSILLITLTVFLFELSYRKNDGNICIHGIECFVLALFTLISIYTYTMYVKNLYLMFASFSFILAVYYVGKAIIIHIKIKKQYIASLNDICEIIKK